MYSKTHFCHAIVFNRRCVRTAVLNCQEVCNKLFSNSIHEASTKKMNSVENVCKSNCTQYEYEYSLLYTEKFTSDKVKV